MGLLLLWSGGDVLVPPALAIGVGRELARLRDCVRRRGRQQALATGKGVMAHGVMGARSCRRCGWAVAVPGSSAGARGRGGHCRFLVMCFVADSCSWTSNHLCKAGRTLLRDHLAFDDVTSSRLIRERESKKYQWVNFHFPAKNLKKKNIAKNIATRTPKTRIFTNRWLRCRLLRRPSLRWRPGARATRHTVAGSHLLPSWTRRSPLAAPAQSMTRTCLRQTQG